MMKISHSGAEPQNTPQFIVLSHYAGSDWVVTLSIYELGVDLYDVDCTIVSVEVSGDDTVVRYKPFSDDDLPVETVSLDEIIKFNLC